MEYNKSITISHISEERRREITNKRVCEAIKI